MPVKAPQLGSLWQKGTAPRTDLCKGKGRGPVCSAPAGFAFRLKTTWVAPVGDIFSGAQQGWPASPWAGGHQGSPGGCC